MPSCRVDPQRLPAGCGVPQGLHQVEVGELMELHEVMEDLQVQVVSEEQGDSR